MQPFIPFFVSINFYGSIGNNFTLFDENQHYEKSNICQNHTTLQLKLRKNFIYNYYATIPWVLQLLCNYPLEIWCINK